MKTNYNIILLAIVFLCTSGTYAQQKRLSADFRIGINAAQMDIPGANMYKEPKIGVAVGGVVSYKYFSNMQVQTGFFVSKKGLRQHDTSITYSSVGSTKNDIVEIYNATYIQIPLMLGYEVDLSKLFAFNINAGGYGAVGLKGNASRIGSITTQIASDKPVVETIEYAAADLFRARGLQKFDYGLTGSIGFVYDIYTFNLNYEHGIYNISNNEERKLMNRTICLQLGFRF